MHTRGEGSLSSIYHIYLTFTLFYSLLSYIFDTTVDEDVDVAVVEGDMIS